MARPEPTPPRPPGGQGGPSETGAAAAITISVVGSDHGPYAMFDVVAVTTSGATLRGPLLLELGERLTLRVSRGENTVDIPGRVGGVKKGDGHSEPTTDIVFDDGFGARLSPIVG